jgi:hypothetical protein
MALLLLTLTICLKQFFANSLPTVLRSSEKRHTLQKSPSKESLLFGLSEFGIYWDDLYE